MCRDPNNASHIAIIDVDGNINWTSNGGTSWVGNYYGHQSQTAEHVPWLGWLSNNGATNGGQLSAGALFFDNDVANKLWLTSGFGIWYAPNISTSLAARQWWNCSVELVYCRNRSRRWSKRLLATERQ